MRSLRPCSDSSATPSFPSQPEGKIGKIRLRVWRGPWGATAGLSEGHQPSPAQPGMNRELPDVQDGYRKGRETRNQIANIHWIIKKARKFQKNIYFCFIDYVTAFDCVDHNNCEKF